MIKYFDNFLFGVCYYPEHWEEGLVEDDIKRIKDTGMNVVRMGEFAWSKYEPEEGVFDFSFLKKAVEMCGDYDINVILGTPTATPPVWLTKKYPEVLAVTYERQVMQHGSRQHANHTSEKFQELSQRIVRKMAETFKKYDNVIGWQIDNELNCGLDLSYSTVDLKAFRNWLKDKYISIEELNRAWGTVFWSLEYKKWDEVTCPMPTPAQENPSQLLDFRRFTSDSTIGFSKIQYQILKEVTPDKFVTHNGIFNNIDYDKYLEVSLDFLSYDSYPAFGERKGIGRGRSWSKNLSRVRGLNEKFVVMEQQSGPGGQVTYLLPTPEPGQIRLWTYQSIAHGAAGILYFRWRTCPYGAEELWHGILNYDNRPNRRLREISQVGAELRKFGSVFMEAETWTEVAVFKDFDNVMNEQIESYLTIDENAIFQALMKHNIGVDFISDINKIKNYKVVICPRILIVTQEIVNKLEDFANDGGILILGARSGIKNENNHYYRKPHPGLLKELTGIIIEDYTMLPEEYEQEIDFGNVKIQPEQFVEVIRPITAQSLATYTKRYYQGLPAVTENTFGKGRVIYYGSLFNRDSFDILLKKFQDNLEGHPFKEIPEEVEVVGMNYQNDSYYMLLNHSSKSIKVDLSKDYIDLLSEEKIKDRVEPYGVYLIKL